MNFFPFKGDPGTYCIILAFLDYYTERQRIFGKEVGGCLVKKNNLINRIISGEWRENTHL